MKKSYCMKCHRELGSSVIRCSCGCENFVYGDKFHFEGKDIVCECGNKEFKRIIHMDFIDKCVNNFRCTKCGNQLVIESYRELMC